MSRKKGDFIFGNNLEVKKGASLDPRLVVDTKEELYLKATWPYDGDIIHIYNGMVVAVLEDNSQYMLINSTKYNEESGWKKIEAGSSGSPDWVNNIKEISAPLYITSSNELTIDCDRSTIEIREDKLTLSSAYSPKIQYYDYYKGDKSEGSHLTVGTGLMLTSSYDSGVVILISTSIIGTEVGYPIILSEDDFTIEQTYSNTKLRLKNSGGGSSLPSLGTGLQYSDGDITLKLADSSLTADNDGLKIGSISIGTDPSFDYNIYLGDGLTTSYGSSKESNILLSVSDDFTFVKGRLSLSANVGSGSGGGISISTSYKDTPSSDLIKKLIFPIEYWGRMPDGIVIPNLKLTTGNAENSYIPDSTIPVGTIIIDQNDLESMAGGYLLRVPKIWYGSSTSLPALDSLIFDSNDFGFSIEDNKLSLYGKITAEPAEGDSEEVEDYVLMKSDIEHIIPHVVEQTDSEVTIQPNVLNVWGEVASLDITLAEPTDTTIVNEYMVQFISGDTATTLTLPSTIKWMAAPNIQSYKTYQLSIINNLGVIGEFNNE